MENQLLSEIEAFLHQTGMGPSYFGKKAVGNSVLVSRLRDGKTVTLQTADRIRTFISEQRSECGPLATVERLEAHQ